MLISILALQFILPLFLLFWLWRFPIKCFVGILIQFFSVLLVFLALNVIGLWLITPYWVSWLYVVLLMVVFWKNRSHISFSVPTWPDHRSTWLHMLMFSLLAVVAYNYLTRALSGYNSPKLTPVILMFPLSSGEYWVANGGNDVIINSHLKTSDITIPRFQNWRGNAYAIDIVKINKLGFRATGFLPKNPNSYYIYGTHVLAPCQGTVISVAADLPDLMVPEVDQVNMAGNHIILRCKNQQADVVMAHLQQHSLTVKPGDWVNSGELIALVGNSGMSHEPHLHIHAQRPGTDEWPMSGDPIPILFEAGFLVRNERVRIIE